MEYMDVLFTTAFAFVFMSVMMLGGYAVDKFQRWRKRRMKAKRVAHRPIVRRFQVYDLKEE